MPRGSVKSGSGYLSSMSKPSAVGVDLNTSASDATRSAMTRASVEPLEPVRDGGGENTRLVLCRADLCPFFNGAVGLLTASLYTHTHT